MDRTTCAGIGICEGIDSDRFEVRADGKVQVLNDEIEDDAALEVAQDAVTRCPTQSLRVED